MASPAPEDSTVPEPATVPEPEPRLRTSERRSRAAQARRDARFAEAVRLREQGLSLRTVALTLGVERKTARRWLRAGHAPTWRHADRGSSILDPHRAWLEERWQAGCRNTAALWRELEGRGFPGQYSTVRAWGTRRRRQDPAVEPAGASRTSRLVKVLEPQHHGGQRACSPASWQNSARRTGGSSPPCESAPSPSLPPPISSVASPPW